MVLADGVESVRELMEPVVEWHSSKTLRELCLGASPDAKVEDRVRSLNDFFKEAMKNGAASLYRSMDELPEEEREAAPSHDEL